MAERSEPSTSSATEAEAGLAALAVAASAQRSAANGAQRTAASVPLALFERMHRFVDLSRAVRRARTTAELGFLVCNRTRELVAYRQAVLWQRDALDALRIVSASGVSDVDRGSAYVQLLERVIDLRFPASASTDGVNSPSTIQQADARAGAATVIPDDARAQWEEEGAPYLVFIPLTADARCGALLLRESELSEAEGGVASELQELYAHSLAALPGNAPNALLKRARQLWSRDWLRTRTGRRVAMGAGLLLLALLLFPVRLSVVAPSQLVARDPAIISAPLNGVIANMLVEPSARVRAGQPLYRIDDRELSHQLEVAEEEYAVAEERVRQSAQRSFDGSATDSFSSASSGSANPGVGILEHDLERARAQRDYYRGLLARVDVRAPVAGVALYSSPQDWIGRPVKIGEKVMEVAHPEQITVEAWLPAENAIPLVAGDRVLFYPEAFPLSAVRAEVSTIAYLAELPGEGQPLAYRVRARVLEADDAARVGQLGTARLYGERTVFAYLLVRRPLNAVRQWLGW